MVTRPQSCTRHDGAGTTPASDSVAPEPASTTPASNVEPTNTDTTLPPATIPTTDAAAIEGADSSEDAVSERYNGIAASDLSRMWSIIDPEPKTGVTRSAWDTCIAAQFPDASVESIDYDETETYTADGSVFSTGSATLEADGEKLTQPITFEVVEREGGCSPWVP